ncbi:hypothetical protein [Stenotrophomonas maltophilia]|uniref:hypothetical protein n=1 Tax=Stenotrophomonas maltophilia TaxID=40324 RepID=UPI000AAA1F12|nr:hypothetical protein [Stenotrophomonas maltophilia]
MEPVKSVCWQFAPTGWPCLTQAEWASWVQAIGSIAAILIAIAIPATQHYIAARSRQREALDRSRSLGLQLLPHIQAFVQRNNEIWANEHPDDHVKDRGENSCLLGPKAQLALEVPAAIESEVNRLHELGPAAEGLQRAVYNIARAKELVTITYVKGPSSSFGSITQKKPVIFDKAEFYDLMWDALKGLTASQNKIEEFFDHGARPIKARA